MVHVHGENFVDNEFFIGVFRCVSLEDLTVFYNKIRFNYYLLLLYFLRIFFYNF